MCCRLCACAVAVLQCDYAVYEEFASDVFLMCNNAMTFNPEQTDVHQTAKVQGNMNRPCCFRRSLHA